MKPSELAENHSVRKYGSYRDSTINDYLAGFEKAVSLCLEIVDKGNTFGWPHSWLTDKIKALKDLEG